MSERYFVRREGAVRGPFALDELIALRERNQLSRFHEVSLDRISWMKAGEMPELFPPPAPMRVVPRPAPPQPPPPPAYIMPPPTLPYTLPAAQTGYYDPPPVRQIPVSPSPTPRPLPVAERPFDAIDEPEPEDDRSRRRYANEDRPLRFDRNQAPHRGGLILAFGICSLLLVCLPLGIIPWMMGSTDLKEMYRGRMDPSGIGATHVGYILGIVSTVLFLIPLALFFLWIGGLLALVGLGAAVR